MQEDYKNLNQDLLSKDLKAAFSTFPGKAFDEQLLKKARKQWVFRGVNSSKTQ